MTCRDYEDLWNVRLDGRAWTESEAATSHEHALTCVECRRRGAGYEALSRAVEGLNASRTSILPVGLADRVLTDPPAPIRRWVPWGWAAAASLLALLAWQARPAIPSRDHGTPVAPGSQVTLASATPARPLGDALVDAAEASWTLARQASEPAAEVRRNLIRLSLEMPVPRAPAMLTPVARPIPEGPDVRPLSTGARNAFGFLIPASLSRPQENPPPSSRPRGES